MAYVVIARWTARSGEQESVGDAIRHLMEPTRSEPGNQGYQCLRKVDDPCVFVLIEQYDDEAAYTAHRASEHFETYAVNDGIPRLESREREFYVTWEGD